MAILSLSLQLSVLFSILCQSTNGFLLLVPSKISKAKNPSLCRASTPWRQRGGVVSFSGADKRNSRMSISAAKRRATAAGRMSNDSNNNGNNDLDFDFAPLEQDDKANLLTRQFWLARWEAADILEIRLDATLVTCHVLARFLCYDLTLPAKDVPGLNIADVIALLHTFSSAALLCLLWTAAGLIVRLFENVEDFEKIAKAVILAAPIWILLEQVLGWSCTVDTVSMQTGYMTSLDVMLEQVSLGVVGLLATMTLSRLVPKMLR